MDRSGFFGYDIVEKAIMDVTAMAAPQVEAFITVAKVLAILFVSLNLIKDFIKSTDKFIKNSGENPIPITLERIIYTVVFIGILANTNAVLGFFDDVLHMYVSSFNLTDENGSSVEQIFARWDMEYEEARQMDKLANKSSVPVLGEVVNVLTEILDWFSSAFYFIILIIVKGLAWIVHALAYPVFLIERGFLLLVMKLVAPLVFVMATLDSYRDMFFKWIKTYSAIFITGLFFIVVTWFCDALFFKLSRNFLDNAYNGVQQGEILGMDAGYLDRHLIQVCYYSMIVFAKVKLYQSSISLSQRIFS